MIVTATRTDQTAVLPHESNRPKSDTYIVQQEGKPALQPVSLARRRLREGLAIGDQVGQMIRADGVCRRLVGEDKGHKVMLLGRFVGRAPPGCVHGPIGLLQVALRCRQVVALRVDDSPFRRQFAVACDGLVMQFECHGVTLE